jgi:hypothetical protein
MTPSSFIRSHTGSGAKAKRMTRVSPSSAAPLSAPPPHPAVASETAIPTVTSFKVLVTFSDAAHAPPCQVS